MPSFKSLKTNLLSRTKSASNAEHMSRLPNDRQQVPTRLRMQAATHQKRQQDGQWYSTPWNHYMLRTH